MWSAFKEKRKKKLKYLLAKKVALQKTFDQYDIPSSKCCSFMFFFPFPDIVLSLPIRRICNKSRSLLPESIHNLISLRQYFKFLSVTKFLLNFSFIFYSFLKIKETKILMKEKCLTFN